MRSMFVLVAAGSMAFTVGMGTAGAAPHGDASSIATPGTFTLSAERLFGIGYGTVKSSTTVAGTTVDTSTHVTSVRLLVGEIGAQTIYTVPRVGFDYTAIDGLTLGGSIGYLHFSGSTESSSGNTSQSTDRGTSNGLILAPRVGYYLPFDGFGVWLRAGITYYRVSSSSPDTGSGSSSSSTLSGVGLTLEPKFVVNATRDFGVYFGGTFDIALSGTSSATSTNQTLSTTTERDSKHSCYGVDVGFVVWL